MGEKLSQWCLESAGQGCPVTAPWSCGFLWEPNCSPSRVWCAWVAKLMLSRACGGRSVIPFLFVTFCPLAAPAVDVGTSELEGGGSRGARSVHFLFEADAGLK